MARIVGVDLPSNKRGEIALTYIYGIGRSSARAILSEAVIYCRQNRNGRIDIRRCIVDPRLFRSPPTRGRSLNPFFP